jgi:predicted nucleotidyltransferase
VTLLLTPMDAGIGAPPQSEALMAIRDRVLAGCERQTVALVLYGSCARGSQTAASDIDVLQVVTGGCPSPWTEGRINVTQYLPQHLISLGRRGSIFALHLQREGIVIYDPDGFATSALAGFQVPLSFGGLLRELAIAGRALGESTLDRERHLPRLVRLGVYVTRTAAYARALESGCPSFDMPTVADWLQAPELLKLVALKALRDNEHRVAHLDALASGLTTYVGPVGTNRWETVAGLAVAASDKPLAAGLLAQVLTGGGALDYGAMAEFIL